MSFDPISWLLFPTPSASYGVDSFPEELIWVPKSLDPKNASPEDCIPCLFLPYSSARFVLFYIHSNAEDIGRCHAFCCSVRAQFQVHVVAVEYPGYGICPGGPCDEEKATENAFTAFRFIHEVLRWPLDSIILLGRSIGCGPAISLATRYQVAGVITVSPMLSVREIFWDVLGPVAWAVKERFPNKERVMQMTSPFLVVHGQKDSIVPCRHGIELYKACRSRKLLVCPQDMEHNTNLLADITYLVLPMLQFFSLPDYCFEDMKIPSWAYDKRMCPYYKEEPSLLSTRHPSTPVRGRPLGSEPLPSRESTIVHDPTVGCCLQSPNSKADDAPLWTGVAAAVTPLLMHKAASADSLGSPSGKEASIARGPGMTLPPPSPPACNAGDAGAVPAVPAEDLARLDHHRVLQMSARGEPTLLQRTKGSVPVNEVRTASQNRFRSQASTPPAKGVFHPMHVVTRKPQTNSESVATWELPSSTSMLQPTPQLGGFGNYRLSASPREDPIPRVPAAAFSAVRGPEPGSPQAPGLRNASLLGPAIPRCDVPEPSGAAAPHARGVGAAFSSGGRGKRLEPFARADGKTAQELLSPRSFQQIVQDLEKHFTQEPPQSLPSAVGTVSFHSPLRDAPPSCMPDFPHSEGFVVEPSPFMSTRKPNGPDFALSAAASELPSCGSTAATGSNSSSARTGSSSLLSDEIAALAERPADRVGRPARGVNLHPKADDQASAERRLFNAASGNKDSAVSPMLE
eukprot:TRINITY_DN9243_c0_g1_i1.p1 TRINITY_DN9243_c0_g1~~TRINITY_DN9243_c0_g1_i1.p1  ORF type:complete len:742 (-),score=127.09 TRINITY_DN9243_c0_g1_i1:215-2440(-)